MSSGARHKMYDYEVAPPQGVWEKIEAELEESELSHKFPSVLYQLEAEPPSTAWQHIAMALNEPAMESDYAAKLSGIEVIPPVRAWEKISAALDPRPAKTSILVFVKYAAAAAVIGLMIFGGIRLFNTNKKESPIANQPGQSTGIEHLVTADNGAASNNEGDTKDPDPIEQDAKDDAALEESKKTYALLGSNSRVSKVKNVADFFFIADDYNYEPTVSTRGLPDFSEEWESPAPDISDRYIVLMTPDGNIIRMPKKFGDLVCCVSGEEVDKDCKDQLQQWRSKIANPAVTHTPGNFLDLLHMLKTLQD